ncbi:hypothetical protein A6723_019915 [Pseudomonas sp. AU11447]|uniref:hypothetical protein n=1 Tax=Pseudomonas sp. AU11447 TaxID=1843184 RepID=UPI0007ED69EA|nr:hypothetical protein [Pseudomonas sp. AU11447]OBY90575.1 hypothetical protein A6723_019915 [Pseudomonas sp. AU11447]
MASIAKERPCGRWGADVLVIPLAADAVIYQGTAVMLNATGFGIPGQEAPDLIFVGAAIENADNTDGIDGGAVVRVRRPVEQALQWVNDGTFTRAHLLKTAYVLDNQTATAEDGEGSRSPMGQVVLIERDFVWIQ